MITALALSAAVLWGVWSFGTGRYGRLVSHWTVILLSSSAAALVYVVAGLLVGGLVIDPADLLPGVLGGALNLCGTALILQAYSRGKLGVAAGISPADVLIPLGYSFLLGEELPLIAGLGIIVIFIGLVLFTLPSARVPGPLSGGLVPIALAALSAVFYGAAVVVLDIGTRTNLYVAMATSALIQVVVTLVLIARARSFGGLTRRTAGPLLASGLALGLGSVAFYKAADEGDVGVVSVLASLSPIVTALLAWWILKERMARPEVLALVVVLAGTAMVVT